MDVKAISASRLKVLSYLDIVLGGIGVFLDMMGVGVLLAGGMSITEMAGQQAGPVISGLVILLTALMLVTGYLLTEADMDRNSRLTGWLLLVIGGIFIVDMASSAVLSASQVPAAVLWAGILLSVTGEAALILGGSYLRRLL
jgi:hypothetical protein